MPSSYSTAGLELPADGEQSGTWGETTNRNMQIISRLISEAGAISLSGTSHTLTVSNGVLSDGQYSVLVFGGSPSGTNTVTISPNDAKRVFIVQNSSGQSVTLTQGSGGDVSVADGSQAIVYCDGNGTGAEVVDITSTYLRTENNLSDLADAPTALTNLGLTATAAELNKLHTLATTKTELGYVNGVTSAIQDQLDNKAPIEEASIATSISLTGAASDWKFSLSGNDLVISYGATSLAKLDTSGNLTVIGNVTAFGTV